MTSDLDPAAVTYIAGHRGLVGSALWRSLEGAGFTSLVGQTHGELDLRNRDDTFKFFAQANPRYVILAAARVGGIAANAAYPYEFLSDNLRIQVNVMDAALKHKAERLVFLGSSCIYPRMAPQPIREEYLLTGKLEPTNDAYAIAKIAGITQVQAARREHGCRWISVMPTNLYGPHDNFSLDGSHVLAALIRRLSDAQSAGARSVTNWGTGSPRREFLHVDDLASAVVELLANYDSPEIINIGTGQDLSIKDISGMVADAVGFTGRIQWDTSKPDGTPRKLLDITRLKALGWKPSVPFEEGIAATVSWYRLNSML